MDFYRLFSGKAIKVGALIAVLVCSGYMLLSYGIIELVKFALETDPSTIAGMEMFISQAAWANGVDFAEIVISGMSIFSLFIGCMITANFIGSEQSCGYAKNFAGQLSNKGYMAVSKFVVTSVALILILVVYTIVAGIFATVVFGKYLTGYDITALLGALGLKSLLYLAVNAIIIFICTLTKSHAVAMIFGFIFGSGITRFVYFAVAALLGAAKINISIADYMPDGINGQIALDTVGNLATKAILVSVAFMVVFIAANFVLLRKRDVK
jgi:ABC-type transport system involved in multi-copper enzyme maturation permease subunit